MSCDECKKGNLKSHKFNTPCDYELHAETALSEIYAGHRYTKKIIEELLYTLDHLEKPEKNNLMSILLKETPQYNQYLSKSGECANIKGCQGKSCECLAFKTYYELSTSDKQKVRHYAKMFYKY
jgi:hypothetical protein